MSPQIVVMLKGKPLTLIGDEVKAGQKARNFKVFASDMSERTLSDFEGKIKLIASVPSVNTPVCNAEIQRFNNEAASLTKDLVILFVSTDMPFVQKRFCDAFGVNKVEMLSDYRDADFGLSYGVLIEGMRLLARAIFLLDKDNTVRYIEYVKELMMPPNYEAALQAIKDIIR